VSRLEARGVGLDFEGVRALDGVDLSLTGGMVHGLVGPNGSGKSTLLRCLSGTLVPDRGSVLLDGRDLRSLSEAQRVAAGVVRTFQRTAVMPHLRVAEHVEVGLRLRHRHAGWAQALLRTPAYQREVGAAGDTRDDLLRTFGLTEHAEDLPETLSGGRQRLLQMATAVATGPAVVLLDEPSAGMSPDETALLHAALEQLVAAGLAILLIEHNMRFLAGIAATVTVLDGGVRVAEGTPAQVARDPLVRRAYLGAGRVSAAPTRRPRSRPRTTPARTAGSPPTPRRGEGRRGEPG
jgi:branched-chain amino acid transport system ATP-binding protein